MKNIVDLNHSEAKDFLFKSESYAYFDLPPYLSFEKVLSKISQELGSSELSDYYDRNIKPHEVDDVNYKIMGNKDGKFDWRPFELIHPAFYVWLVNTVTTSENWQTIVNRFQTFNKNNLVQCKSLPVVSQGSKSDKAEQIRQWWIEVEQESIKQGLNYEYLLETDIVDCYGSIYTHSIAWALHTRPDAKSNHSNSLLGNKIDSIVKAMCSGQTNGIPQGSVLMDLIAELVLGYVDELLTGRLTDAEFETKDFKIIRYRDDYRMFSNSPEKISKIVKILTEVLIDFGHKLNSNKTSLSNYVLSSSLKEDKLYWLKNKRDPGSLYEELQLIHSLSESYPNSGTLIKLLSDYQEKIADVSKIDENIEAMISYIVDIAYKNPRVYSVSAAILSKLFSLLNKSDVERLAIVIQKKFQKIPNTGLMQIWLQRALIHSELVDTFSEPLCQIVSGQEVQLWNSSWLKSNIQGFVDVNNILDKDKLDNIDPIIQPSEVQIFSY